MKKLKALFNLKGQSKGTKKKQKNPQNQQGEKENKKGSLKENVPVAGPSTSKTVTTSDNSQESCRTNKHQNKKPPNIKATESTPPEISKKNDTKAEINKETYKKKGGTSDTSDHGHEYEYSMCAYLALELLSKDKNVINFTMTSNNAALDIFDDIELIVTFSDESSHTFCIQLKHSEKNGYITKEIFDIQEGDFNLKKYFESGEIKQNREDMTCVLFTNKSSKLKDDDDSLTHKDINGKVTVKPYKLKNDKHLLINTAERSEKTTCFQLELHQNEDNPKDVTEFFPKLYLFTNQIGVKECQSLIKETLNNLFGCNIDFVGFMHHWWKNNFVLTRHDVITKLAELALGPYIQEIPIKSENSPSEESKALKNAIEKFDMTVITECNNDKVRKMWAGSSDEIETADMSKAALKYGLSTTGISNKDKMLALDQSKVLWHLNKVPLIVKYEEDAKVRILEAVELLGTEKKKMKLILLGNHSRDDFNATWKVFENLYDLQDEKSYKKIIETFKVSLQGRTSISLEQLIQVNNQEIAKDIKTKELFQMLEKPLCIGKPQTKLPEFYIPRTITTLLLDIEQVLDYYISSKNDLLILICNGEMKNVIASKIPSDTTSNIKDFSSSMFFQNRYKRSSEQKLEIKEFDDSFSQKPFSITQGSKTLLFSTKKNFTTKEFAMICEQNSQLNIYLLQIIDLERCVMAAKKGNITQFKEIEYKKSAKKEITEDKLFSIFKNSLNVVTGKPGIGKSSLFTSLSRECPSDYWCVRINLVKFNSVFKDKLNHEAVLDKILKNSVKQVSDTIYLDKFKSSNRIYLLLDGLDEMESDCIKQVLEFIKFISETGIKVWVSSRENLREKLEREMYVVPIEIQELTEIDQRNYISKRLLSNTSLDKKYSKDEVESITTEIFKSVSINYNAQRLLGIPIQLYIITEIFRQRRQAEFTEESFVLSKIYRRFFEGKFEHHKAKLGIKNIEALDDNLDHDLKQYELPALRACLDGGTFNKLKLNESELDESRTFLEQFKKRGNRLGIISQVVDEDQKLQAIFYHQSFAEYFACRWLERNVAEHRLIKNEFFEDKYQNLRLIFDIMLAEDKPLHLATIYKSPEHVKKYIEQRSVNDKGGRNALHIICSYCEVAPKGNLSWYIKTIRRNEDEILRVLEILKLLLQYYNPSEKDSLFEWDCQGYALHSNTLLPFDICLETLKENNFIINEDLFKRFSDDELVNYCSYFGYPHLLKAIINKCANITNKMSGDLIWQAVRECVKSKEEYFINLYIETIKVLADAGCQINKRYARNYANTPLLYACDENGSCILLETLLAYGADINVVNNENKNVLHLATIADAEEEEINPEIIEFLIKKGAKVNQVDKDNCTPLHYASMFGNSDIMTILLNNGADINAVTVKNWTVLHLASDENKPEIIEFLINKGAQVNQVNLDNWTPLHRACAFNTRDVIEVLLNNGADINAVTDKNYTVLHLASEENKPEIIEFLIKKEMQVNQVAINNETPLHKACSFNTRDVIEVLLNNGADINAVTDKNHTVLHLASEENKPEIIEFLIKREMQVNQVAIYNETSLHRACTFNTRDVIEVLLNNGADINAVTDKNYTVLHLASEKNKPEIIEFLIKREMQVNQVAINNETPLHRACTFNTRDVIEVLLNNGADINAVTDKNYTILHLASEKNKPEIIEFLIKREMQVNQVAINNETPLHRACACNTCDVIEVLLNNGADINAVTDKNQTVLHLASAKNKPEIIEFLIKREMQVNQVNIDNWTSLHFAAAHNTRDVIEILLNNGADINAITNMNQTILHLASTKNKPEIIEFLIKREMQVNQVAINNVTPLHCACAFNTRDVIEVLLNNGADINAVTVLNENVLHCALDKNRNPEMVEYLIEKGAQVNQADINNSTSLHYACEYSTCDVIEILLNNGADIYAVTNQNETMLDLARMNENIDEDSYSQLLQQLL